MKQQSGQPLAYAAGRQLAERIGSEGRTEDIDLLASIPKYWIKRLVTGVNSAETIMSGLSRQAKKCRVQDLLVCQRRINKQSLLSPDQRRRNVRGAWRVSDRYDVEGLRIMLVDDIMTTGATANAAARALKHAGAASVTVAVVGRASKV